MPALFKSGCVGAAQLSPCPVNPLCASDEQAETQKTKGNMSVSQGIGGANSLVLTRITARALLFILLDYIDVG